MKISSIKAGLLSIDTACMSTSHICTNVQKSSLKSIQRSLHTSYVLDTKKGAGKEQGRMRQDELRKMVENEERGIFRKLDLGLPQQWTPDEKFKKYKKASFSAPSR